VVGVHGSLGWLLDLKQVMLAGKIRGCSPNRKKMRNY